VSSLGVRATVTRLSGGGAKSPMWHQLFADIFDTPVATLETQEGSAYGAALLAMAGTGEYGSVTEICERVIKEQVVRQQLPEPVKFYRSRYEIYRGLYPALKPAFRAISELDG